MAETTMSAMIGQYTLDLRVNSIRDTGMSRDDRDDTRSTSVSDNAIRTLRG